MVAQKVVSLHHGSLFQGWAQINVCEETHTFSLCLWVSSRLSFSLPKYTSMSNGYVKLPQIVKECVHGALNWPEIPRRVYSWLTTSVPGIDFASTKILTRIKQLLKLND